MPIRVVVRAAMLVSLSGAWPVSAGSQTPVPVRITVEEVTRLARVVDGVPQAKPVHEVQPSRPASLPGMFEGSVTIKLTVAKDGSVKDAKVVTSNQYFDEAALGALRQWRFEPILVNRAPVEVVLTKTVTFPKSPGLVTLSGTGPVIEVPSPKRQERVGPPEPVVSAPVVASGRMVVEVTVGASGQVKNAQVLRGVSPVTDRAVVDAIRKWTYEQTIINSLPVEAVMVVYLSVSS